MVPVAAVWVRVSRCRKATTGSAAPWKGVFTDVVYEDREPDGTKLRLTGDSYEVLLFSCGHEVRGTSLATADAERLTVEARDSEEATDPVDEPEDEPTDEP